MVVGEESRLISSHVPEPTSPIQGSLVPGRNVNRKGFRKPYATIRRAFASLLPASGLPAAPAPVLGSSRRSAPSSVVGSPVVRRSWLRRAPPSAVGGVSLPPTPAGGSPHGFFGVRLPALPPPWP